MWSVTIDVRGLERLLGQPQTIGEELRREAARRGVRVHVAVAATRTTALVLAIARPGLTVVDPGGEAAALAPLPIGILEKIDHDHDDQRRARGARRERSDKQVAALEPPSGGPESPALHQRQNSATLRSLRLIVGDSRRWARWRRCPPPICRPGSGSRASSGRPSREAKTSGRSCRMRRTSGSSRPWSSSGRSRASNRCRSCSRGCSNRCRSASNAATAAWPCCTCSSG